MLAIYLDILKVYYIYIHVTSGVYTFLVIYIFVMINAICCQIVLYLQICNIRSIHIPGNIYFCYGQCYLLSDKNHFKRIIPGRVIF